MYMRCNVERDWIFVCNLANSQDISKLGDSLTTLRLIHISPFLSCVCMSQSCLPLWSWFVSRVSYFVCNLTSTLHPLALWRTLSHSLVAELLSVSRDRARLLRVYKFYQPHKLVNTKPLHLNQLSCNAKISTISSFINTHTHMCMWMKNETIPLRSNCHWPTNSCFMISQKSLHFNINFAHVL